MTAHPLDPLTADEFRAAAAVLRRDQGVDERWRFASIELREPAKDVVRSFAPGDPIRREARVTCWSRDEGTTYKALVSLTDDALLSWEAVPGEQANMTLDEWHEAHEALIAHPDVIAALAKRGITDLDLVLIDTWAYGHSLIPAEFRDRRVGWTDVWRRSTPLGSPYANPVERPALRGGHEHHGAAAHRGRRPAGRRLADGRVPPRPGARAGPAHRRQGAGHHPAGGPLLHPRRQRAALAELVDAAGLQPPRGAGHPPRRATGDGEEVRPIAHRLSFAEMVVPYRDPADDHHRRTAFDIGEWGLGFMTTSLELGCDCLGDITYVDAELHDSRGEPYTIKNAICLHEEDDGVLWKHVDEKAGAEVRRSRRMVVSFHATVANYEYLTYWRFYQDGTIECEVRATGIMVTSSFDGDAPPTGTVVDDQTYAPFHQHFIVARMDMEIDGPENTVVVSESEAVPISDTNPYGLALVQRSRALETESEGRQDYDWASQRGWKVVNRGHLNRLGTPTGYKLVASASFPALVDRNSPIMARAGVIDHTLWVTPFAEEERWPAGEFCNQSRGSDGLPKWTQADRPIADTDIVLWHVFGIHHIPRPEDWPVMPVDTVSFSLKPWGFFDRNPALDVPPNPGRCH